MNSMNAFDRTVMALRQQGLTDSEILETLSQLFRNLDVEKQIPYKEKTVEERIETILLRLGISSKLTGYRYLVRTAAIYVENPQHLTKVIYPIVAKEFNTTFKAIEKSMRYAIGCAWEKCPIQIKEELFGDTAITYEKKAPTNSQLMFMIRKNLVYQNNE